MDLKTFDALRSALHQTAQDIQNAKRPGYTLGKTDVLHNFRSAAARANMTIGQAWTVLWLKHVDAICSFMCQPDLPVSEAPIGRFADNINYTELGYAIWQEMNDQKVRVPHPFSQDELSARLMRSL